MLLLNQITKLHSDEKKKRKKVTGTQKTTATLLQMLKYIDNNMKMNKITCSSGIKIV